MPSVKGVRNGRHHVLDPIGILNRILSGSLRVATVVSDVHLGVIPVSIIRFNS